MIRKKLAILCGMAVLLCSSSAVTNVQAATTDPNYSGEAAAAYAEKWAENYNTKQYYNAGLDCTNFVSQCLAAGGKSVSTSLPSYDSPNHWKPHSATWENAQAFKTYWKKKVTALGKNIGTLSTEEIYAYADRVYKRLEKGDVIQYGHSINDTGHSQICHKKGKDSEGNKTLLMAQHTGNEKNIALHSYLKNTYYSYVTYYRMGQIK